MFLIDILKKLNINLYSYLLYQIMRSRNILGFYMLNKYNLMSHYDKDTKTFRSPSVYHLIKFLYTI